MPLAAAEPGIWANSSLIISEGPPTSVVPVSIATCELEAEGRVMVFEFTVKPERVMVQYDSETRSWYSMSPVKRDELVAPVKTYS